MKKTMAKTISCIWDEDLLLNSMGLYGDLSTQFDVHIMGTNKHCVLPAREKLKQVVLGKRG